MEFHHQLNDESLPEAVNDLGNETFFECYGGHLAVVGSTDDIGPSGKKARGFGRRDDFEKAAPKILPDTSNLKASDQVEHLTRVPFGATELRANAFPNLNGSRQHRWLRAAGARVRVLDVGHFLEASGS